jgi:hypothetical protein
MEQETRKQCIKKIREQVAGGKPASRTTLLAYGFLRGRDYVELERVINEDKFPEEGRNTFLSYLARGVVYSIKAAAGFNAPYPSPEHDEQISKLAVIEAQVKSWINKKYAGKDEKSKEAAA